MNSTLHSSGEGMSEPQSHVTKSGRPRQPRKIEKKYNKSMKQRVKEAHKTVQKAIARLEKVRGHVHLQGEQSDTLRMELDAKILEKVNCAQEEVNQALSQLETAEAEEKHAKEVEEQAQKESQDQLRALSEEGHREREHRKNARANEKAAENHHARVLKSQHLAEERTLRELESEAEAFGSDCDEIDDPFGDEEDFANQNSWRPESFLRAEYEKSKEAASQFPPKLTQEHLRKCCKDFHRDTESRSCSMACGDCGIITNDTVLLKEDDFLFKALEFKLDPCCKPLPEGEDCFVEGFQSSSAGHYPPPGAEYIGEGSFVIPDNIVSSNDAVPLTGAYPQTARAPVSDTNSNDGDPADNFSHSGHNSFGSQDSNRNRCGNTQELKDLEESIRVEREAEIPRHFKRPFAGAFICKKCYYYRSRGKPPKFSRDNGVNTHLCIQMPWQLQGLNWVEECTIAIVHCVGIIMKLTEHGSVKNGIAHFGTRGHWTAYKQDPGKLSTILPDPEFKLYKVITVTWVSDNKMTAETLSKFAAIRPTRIKVALVWLKQHHPYYKDIEINFDLIREWTTDYGERFVDPEVLANVVQIPPKENRPGNESYISNQSGSETFENDFDAMHPDVPDGTMMSGTLAMTKEPPLVATSHIFSWACEQSAISEAYQNQQAPVIVAANRDDEHALGHISFTQPSNMTPESVYNNPAYFVGAFPTLFPYGIGGHLDKRPIAVSLAQWAKWALLHHSRRFSEHHIFSLFVYDILRIQEAAITNRVNIKAGYFKQLSKDLSTLKSDELDAAANALKAGEPVTHPVINRLFSNIKSISSGTKDGFGRKMAMRRLMFGYFLRYGPPAFWLTLNPSDLSSPLVLSVAGIRLDVNMPLKTRLDIQRRCVISDPVVVAQFFQITIAAMFGSLLKSGNTEEMGILGPIIAHIGVVESTLRGMLHAHCLLWLHGGHDVSRIRKQIIDDEGYAQRMIDYVETIVSESMDLGAQRTWQETHDSNYFFEDKDPSMTLPEWTDHMDGYVNNLANPRQMHKHNACCRKYGIKAKSSKRTAGHGDGELEAEPERVVKAMDLVEAPLDPKSSGKRKREVDQAGEASSSSSCRGKKKKISPTKIEYCRFNLPEEERLTTTIDKHGNIYVKRNNGNIVKYNKYILSVLRSNHDINFLMSKLRGSVAAYYMTNYSTKDDLKFMDVIVSAAIRARAIEEEKIDKNVRTDWTKHAMKVYNMIIRKVHVSNPSCVNLTIGGDNYFGSNFNTRCIPLYLLRREMRSIVAQCPHIQWKDDEGIKSRDEDYVLPPHSEDDNPLRGLDDYKYRNQIFKHFSLYEYFAQVERKSRSQAKGLKNIFPFGSGYPRGSKSLQRFLTKAKDFATPNILGNVTSLSLNTVEKEKREHVLRTAVENDICEILIGLFIPWDKFSSLLHSRTFDGCEHSSIFREAWQFLQCDLEEYMCQLVQNFRSLRCSKEEAEIDAEMAQQRAASHDSDESVDRWAEDFAQEDFGEASYCKLQEEALTSDELLAVMDRLLDSWAMLGDELYVSPPLNADEVRSNENGVEKGDMAECEEWQTVQKSLSKKDALSLIADFTSDEIHEHGEERGDTDNNTSVDSSNALAITPDIAVICLKGNNIDILRAQVGDICTVGSLMEVVQPIYRLNAKQYQAVHTLLATVLQSKQESVERCNAMQKLVYIGGIGGTGKTEVIKAFALGMLILNDLDKVKFSAPTGAAAANINGETLHAMMGFSICGMKSSPSAQVRLREMCSSLLALIIDEISMVSTVQLEAVSSNLNRSAGRSTGSNLDDNTIFGGIPLVIVLGDFHQFQPVKGISLWDWEEAEVIAHSEAQHKPGPIQDLHRDGKEIWHRFKEVIILTQSMRQCSDIVYQAMLARSRLAKLSTEDCNILNSQTVQKRLARGDIRPSTTIVRRNKLRWKTNREAIMDYAKRNGQKIYIFASTHTGTLTELDRRLGLRTNMINAHARLLDQGDQANICSPGLFMYTKNMPIMCLRNICTPTGIVNGMSGKAKSVKLNPASRIFEISPDIILVDLPPACIIIQIQGSPIKHSYQGLCSDEVPLFPVKIGGMFDIGIRGKQQCSRVQVPCTPAFAITDYKAQGISLDQAVLDLKRPKDDAAHKAYTSTVVQMGRVRTLDGVWLLDKITPADITCPPKRQLSNELCRLEALDRNTEERWKVENMGLYTELFAK